MANTVTTISVSEPFEIEKTDGNAPAAKSGDITNEVVAAFCAGDHRAFETIYLRCMEPIRGFLRMVLRNDAVAEDLCQELFVRLWENRHMVNPELNLWSYIKAAAKSSAMNYLRHKQVAEKYTNFRLNMGLNHSNAPDEQLMASELQFLMRGTLNKLPEQRRRVFEMSRDESLSNTEIADRLGISESTVRVHLHKALKELGELLMFCLIIFIYL